MMLRNGTKTDSNYVHLVAVAFFFENQGFLYREDVFWYVDIDVCICLVTNVISNKESLRLEENFKITWSSCPPTTSGTH